MDTVWIKTRMRKLKITQEDIAEAIGISASAVNHKIHNRRPTYLNEGAVIARILRMTPSEVMKHLFTSSEAPF